MDAVIVVSLALFIGTYVYALYAIGEMGLKYTEMMNEHNDLVTEHNELWGDVQSLTMQVIEISDELRFGKDYAKMEIQSGGDDVDEGGDDDGFTTL